MSVTDLSAVAVAERIAGGQLSAEDYLRACLERRTAVDGDIGAWVHLDEEQALARAREMDELRRHGQPLGALHGVPVAVKDIFDTADMPTAHGSPQLAGRRPGSDSAVVEKLREAGCVVPGKTATAEFAYLHPAATRNPHDPSRTPGGSSSGSAAAVASGQVPLAVGSQTNGSTVRPASFCGVFGFKPSRGVISRRGALCTSQNLDQVGVFGRSLEDVAILADVLAGYDAADAASYLRPRPRMLAGCRAEVPAEPDFAWFDLPYADRLSAASREGFQELMDALGDRVERLPAPASFQEVVECQQVIHEVELDRNLKDYPGVDVAALSEGLRAAMERGSRHDPARYRQALAMQAGADDYFATFFRDYDAILTPASAGEAPPFEAGTGDPVFCTIWTFSGLPCLSLPLLVGENGLPVGVQLVGSANGDDRLLRTAAWLLERLAQETDDND